MQPERGLQSCEVCVSNSVASGAEPEPELFITAANESRTGVRLHEGCEDRSWRESVLFIGTQFSNLYTLLGDQSRRPRCRHHRRPDVGGSVRQYDHQRGPKGHFGSVHTGRSGGLALQSVIGGYRARYLPTDPVTGREGLAAAPCAAAATITRLRMSLGYFKAFGRVAAQVYNERLPTASVTTSPPTTCVVCV